MEEQIKSLKEQRSKIFDAYKAIQNRLDQIRKSDFFGTHPLEESWPVIDNLINQARQARSQLTALDFEIEFLEFELNNK